MTYASASDVGLYCPEIIGANSEFSDATDPTRVQVERWLDKGYSRINTAFAGHGYATPVQSSATVYDAVVDLEALYAAARAQFARMSSRLAATERAKGQIYLKQFNDELTALFAQDLTRAGVARASGGKLWMGGISESDKDSYEDDADRVKPRFKRDQFRASGAELPNSNTIDEESE